MQIKVVDSFFRTWNSTMQQLYNNGTFEIEKETEKAICFKVSGTIKTCIDRLMQTYKTELIALNTVWIPKSAIISIK